MSSTHRASIAAALIAVLAASPIACKKSTDSEDGQAAGAAAADDIDIAAAAAAARQRSEDEVKVPFLGTDRGKFLCVKLLGRQVRNAHKPDVAQRLGDLARACVEHGDLELVAMAYFYLGYLEAKGLSPDASEADKARVVGMIRDAVDLGYANPYEISEADPLRPLFDRPDFQQIMVAVEAKYEDERRSKTKQAIDSVLAASKNLSDVHWMPELSSLDGESIWRADQPMLVVVSRIHHDGFDKLYPTIQATVDRLGDRLPAAVVFYQYDLDDTGRIEQTEEYIRHLDVELPCAVIGRAKFEELMKILEERHGIVTAARVEADKDLPKERRFTPMAFNPFQPLGLFLDADRSPLYVSRGVVAPWELDYAVDGFLEIVGVDTESDTDASADSGDAEGDSADVDEETTAEDETASDSTDDDAADADSDASDAAEDTSPDASSSETGDADGAIESTTETSSAAPTTAPVGA